MRYWTLTLCWSEILLSTAEQIRIGYTIPGRKKLYQEVSQRFWSREWYERGVISKNLKFNSSKITKQIEKKSESKAGSPQK